MKSTTKKRVLTANDRKHIAPKNFALPGGRYPIPDKSHAQNALARVSQFGSDAEKAKVRSKVQSKFPSMGKSARKAKRPASDLYPKQEEPMGYRKAKKPVPQRKNHRSMSGKELLGKGMKKLAGC